MKQIMQCLIDHLFDYAGLFPPASLPLLDAVQNYLEYQKSDDGHYLGNFILPTSMINNYLENIPVLKHSIPFSIVFPVKENSEDRLLSFQNHLNLIKVFQQNRSEVQICALEVVFTEDFYHQEKESLYAFLNLCFDEVENKLKESRCDLFIELPFFKEDLMDKFIKKIENFNKASNHKTVFLKLRTGGITPESVPSTEKLAHALYSMGKSLIPFKVTAGLHVPVPNFNAGVNARLHGFLNVLIAGSSAYLKNFEKNEIEEILNSLHYDDIQLINNEIRVNNKLILKYDDIQQFRAKYFKGIGSCDFLEPLEHLKTHFAFSV